MNRIGWIKCLLGGHRWGLWLPGYVEEDVGHHRFCERCGKLDEHPNPRLLEMALGWFCRCPRCGRRGIIAGSRIEATPCGTVYQRPCFYVCLECMMRGPGAKFSDRLWWERDPKLGVLLPWGA